MNEYLVQIINDYIGKENVDGALYIDGAWGSGKTHFLKDFQEDYNKNNRGDAKIDPCLYISLSGMKETREINEELYSLCHPNISKFGNSKVGKSIFTTIKMIGNYFGIDKDNIEDLKNNISSFLNSNCSILILDDFERCRIDLQELFAYIVSLILDGNVRVILVGNDEEVRKFLQESYVFKEKLIASNISKDYENYAKNLNNIKEPILYDSIKEKCIYKTCFFSFDENILFNQISKDYSKSTQAVIKKCKKTITRILVEKRCSNLRTCKFAIDVYNDALKMLRKKFVNDAYIKREIFLTIFFYAILFKNGDKIEQFKEKYFDQNTIIFPIEDLGKYVYYGAFNKELIIKKLEIIDNDYTKAISKEVPKSIIKLNTESWYTKKDEQLVEEIHDLKADLANIQFDYYYTALYFFYSYLKWFPEDSEINMEDILEKMSEIINNSEDEIDYDEDSLFFERPDGFNSYVSRLTYFFKNHNSNARVKSLSVSKEGLASYTPDDFTKIEKDSYKYRSFFARLDIDQLIKTIEDGSPGDIILVRRFLQNVYGKSGCGSFFQDDYSNLVLFYEKLSKLEIKSIIKKKNIELLMQDVIEDIEELKAWRR